MYAIVLDLSLCVSERASAVLYCTVLYVIQCFHFRFMSASARAHTRYLYISSIRSSLFLAKDNDMGNVMLTCTISHNAIMMAHDSFLCVGCFSCKTTDQIKWNEMKRSKLMPIEYWTWPFPFGIISQKELKWCKANSSNAKDTSINYIYNLFAMNHSK